MADKPTPKDGCFRAATSEHGVGRGQCQTAPAIPFRPAAAGAKAAGTPMTVGNGTDMSSSAPGTISWAEGSFPSVSGVTSITDYGSANDFSLQIELELHVWILGVQRRCANPSACRAWQQFVYSAPSDVFMQYWLINYDNTCPSGWWSYGSDCYTNSTGTTSPTVTAGELGSVALTGTAGGSPDTVGAGAERRPLLGVPGEQRSAGDINQRWSAAEFNLIGNGDGSGATFNSGSTVTVQTLTNMATEGWSAPSCAGEGFTGETNNLSITGCCPIGGTVPGIQFVESNVANAPAPVCGALPAGTFQATIQSGVDDKCLIFGGDGANANPSRYLWGGGTTPFYCGLGSEAALLATQQAVFTFVPLGVRPVPHPQRLEWHRRVPHVRRQRHEHLPLALPLAGRVLDVVRVRQRGGPPRGPAGRVASPCPLQGNQYALMNASNKNEQCLIFGGNGAEDTYPSRYNWASNTTSTWCGLGSLSAELSNEQSVWISTPLL